MTLPNLTTPITGNTYGQQSLLALHLLTKVEAVVSSKKANGYITMGVVHGLKVGAPAVAILRELAEQAADNRETMDEMFGATLVQEIVAYVGTLKSLNKLK